MAFYDLRHNSRLMYCIASQLRSFDRHVTPAKESDLTFTPIKVKSLANIPKHFCCRLTGNQSQKAKLGQYLVYSTPLRMKDV
jgi:hypothetical protein